MVIVDRSYDPCNYFAVYAGIVRQSAKTFDIKYNTESLYFALFRILKFENT